jgi:SPP1 family predicted phage head-tail adaptor
MPRAGDYDTRGEFQRADEVVDAALEEDLVWPPAGGSVIATRFGKLRPWRGLERFQGMQTDVKVDHELRIRYDSTVAGITAKDRYVVGSRVFDIESVHNVNEEGRELEFLLKELV